MSLPTLGKYLYTVPFVAFGILHFLNTEALAMKLLGLLLLIIVVTIHVPGMLGGGADTWMTPMLHTTGLAGAAFVLAGVHEGS